MLTHYVGIASNGCLLKRHISFMIRVARRTPADRGKGSYIENLVVSHSQLRQLTGSIVVAGEVQGPDNWTNDGSLH